MPRAAHGAFEHPVGLGVVDKAFLIGIPFQFALERHGDIAEVTDRGRAMADFHRRCC